MYTTTTVLALLASIAAAKNATILNPYFDAATLTQIGSDASATTYVQNCPSGKAGLAPGVTDISQCLTATNTGGNGTAVMTAMTDAPSTTAAARRFRRAESSHDPCDGSPDQTDICEPFTLTQGASKWEIHLTDPAKGLLTIDANCAWSGELSSADITCMESMSGFYIDELNSQESTAVITSGVDTTTIAQTDVSAFNFVSNVAVVTSTASESSTQPTGTAAGKGSPGVAPGAPLPTGVVAWGAGAAGIFAAALAL
ncbi:hypothetical protein K491DRAFT_682393 [Lophiostoma macrostomum CBS 122681]|uniref:Uncharacterized protein n=1 Tax=Lophiostoma macrostomum CBS 122681 TaxID=1314788 RepID=A0A6A6SY55_9PLEO|nr:hypothetical protein K491DRAFT_682393 [Lophiostoma macrostomum CBS 122681]